MSTNEVDASSIRPVASPLARGTSASYSRIKNHHDLEMVFALPVETVAKTAYSLSVGGETVKPRCPTGSVGVEGMAVVRQQMSPCGDCQHSIGSRGSEPF